MRTRVYTSVVDLLSDGRWHWLSEIGHIAKYVGEWAHELEREPAFEFDATKAMIRLPSVDVVAHGGAPIQTSLRLSGRWAE